MKWVLVLGCYGLMLGAAPAGERWSAESCKHLQEMKAETYALNLESAKSRFWALRAVLNAQAVGCGIDTMPEFNAAKAAALAETSDRRRARAAPPRPVLCDTTPKAYGGSTTDCF
jgi:hypothetical protein